MLAEAEALALAEDDEDEPFDDEQPAINDTAKTQAVNIETNFFIIFPPFITLL